jgi:hypothetical protein
MQSIGRATFPPKVRILSGESELALGTRYSRVTVGYPIRYHQHWVERLARAAEAEAIKTAA